MKLNFDSIYYRVSDLDHAICFYRDVLGRPLVRRDFVAYFDVDGVVFELVPQSSSQHSRASGNAGLCFRVEDVRAVRAELDMKEVRVGPVEEKGNGLLVTFSDPDGNELALRQYR